MTALAESQQSASRSDADVSDDDGHIGQASLRVYSTCLAIRAIHMPISRFTRICAQAETSLRSVSA